MSDTAGEKRKKFLQNLKSNFKLFWYDWFGDINFIKITQNIVLVGAISSLFIYMIRTNPSDSSHISKIKDLFIIDLNSKEYFFNSNKSIDFSLNDKSYSIEEFASIIRGQTGSWYDNLDDELLSNYWISRYPDDRRFLNDKNYAYQEYLSKYFRKNIKVDDYIFFSISKIIFQGKEKVVGFGIFSNVFIFADIANHFRKSLIK